MSVEIKIPSQYSRMMVRTRLLHWGVGFFSAFLAVCLFIWRPMSVQLRGIERQAMEARHKMEKVSAVAQGTKDFDVVLNRLREELSSLTRRTLRPGEQAKVIAILTQITGDLKIGISNIRAVVRNAPAPAADPQVIQPSLFELELLCRYKNLGVFFESLARSPLILTIEEFEAAPSGPGSPLLNVRMVLAAYEEAAA